MTYIKNLTAGDVFSIEGDTLYLCESVTVWGGTASVVYRLVSDQTVRNVVSLPALTSVKVMVFN